MEDHSTEDANAALVEALTQMARAFQSVTAHLGVMSYIVRALLLDRLRDTPDPAQALADFRAKSLRLISEHFVAEDYQNEAVRNEAIAVARMTFDKILERLQEPDSASDFELPNSSNGTIH